MASCAAVGQRGSPLVPGAGNHESRRETGGSVEQRGGACPPGDQWEQLRAVPASSAVRKLEPQPQPDTALGLLTVKPAPIRVST